MLRYLVMSATMLAGLNTWKEQTARHSAFDQGLAETAAELERRAQDVDRELAEAAGVYAEAGDEAAYEQLAALMPRVARDEHAVRTLWRALQARHSELYATNDGVK